MNKAFSEKISLQKEHRVCVCVCVSERERGRTPNLSLKHSPAKCKYR